MFGVLTGFAVILGVIGAGYLAAVAGIVKGDQRRVLNNMSFYVALPALLFDVLHDSDPRVIVSPVILITSVAAILAATLYTIASRIWFPKDLASTTLGATSSGYVNSNNLGLPVAIYILGDAAYVAPLILVQVVIYAPIVLAILESTRGNRGGLWVALGRAVKNPIIIASALGLSVALLRLEVPEIILAPVSMLGAASVPMVLLSFGISLRGQKVLQPGAGRAAVFTGTGIKLLVMPAIAWGLCVLCGLGTHETFVATTIAALPTAQNVFNFAATYQRAELQVRDTVFLTTFASLPIIALIAWLLAA